MTQTLKKQLILSQISNKRSEINEASLTLELSKYFNKLKKEVLNSLEEYWKEYQMLQGHIDLIVSSIHESHQEYYNILEKHILKEYQLGKKRGERLVKLSKKAYSLKSEKTPFKISFDKDNLFKPMPYAEETLLNQTFKASQNTLSRVDNDITRIISEGYRTGKGINYIGDEITKRFDQLATWESKRIARTEIHKSHNMGTMSAYDELGVEYTQWDCHIDGRERDSHRDLSGEIIPIGGTYSNGLRFPGDTSGALKEFINCRCGNLPFVMPFGYIAPPGMVRFRESDLIATLDNWQAPEDILSKIENDVNTKLNKTSENIINPSELPMQGEAYIVDRATEGFEIIDGAPHYKGLYVPEYDFEKGMGYIFDYQIKNHNKKIVFKDMEFPTGKQLLENLSRKEYSKYKDLKEEIDWAIDIQTSTHINKKGKEAGLKKIDEVLPRFKKLNEKALTKTTPKTHGEHINTNELVYSESFDEYSIPKMEFKFNKETKLWEYKGLGVTSEKYNNSKHIIHITSDVLKKHNSQFEVADGDFINGSSILKQKTINDTKYVIDENNKKWVIDTEGEYEHKQDIEQHKHKYSEKQTKSTTDWGSYGHQDIGNLIYGDSEYTNYYIYQPIMKKKITPLLNNMRDKYRIIIDDSIDTTKRMKAINEYQKLEKEFDEIAENIGDKEVTKILQHIKYIDQTLVSSPKLLQDTCLVRYGNFDESMCEVGRKDSLKGFLSTSYDDITVPPDATSHFAEKPNRWKITILAPKGTRGARLNNQFNALTDEREWLLEREQKFEVLEYGEIDDSSHPTGKRKSVLLRLIK